MEDMKKKLVEYLKERKVITLATASPDGAPSTHPVVFANDGPVVYVSTFKGSRKVDNIEKNDKVAYSTYDGGDDWSKTRAVQMEGRAIIVKDEKEAKKAFGLLVEKFPAMKDMAPNPESNVLLRIEPKVCYFSDYSKGFGHMDRIDF